MRLLEVPMPSGTLAVRRFGGTSPGLVALHGFGLHGGQFAGLAGAGGWSVDAPDLPGHGLTTVEPVDLETTLAALAGWIGSRRRVLGYSQGGRLALHLAWRHPELVESLVVVSAGPGPDDGVRAERAAADAAVAELLERRGMAAYLDRWLDDPVFGTTRLDPQTRATDRALRLENDPVRLAAARRRLGQGALPRVPLAQVPAPVLWVAGELDPGYVEAMSVVAGTRGERLAVVGSVGHNVVAEAPEELARLVGGWFEAGG